MKLYLIDRTTASTSSFTTKVNEAPYFLNIWHCHPELEFVVILQSEGSFFVGDRIEAFKKGDVFLIGENTPHMGSNSKSYFQKESAQLAKSIVVHFKKDFLGPHFFETPEMNHLSDLFDRAQFGIKFFKISEQQISKILAMTKQKGYNKTISFLNILNKLSKHKNYKLLVSDGFMNSFEPTKNKTLGKVYTYVLKNFNKKITLDEVANIANMNASAFSRLFKHVNRKTYSRYLSELRIGYACKLLLEDKSNISAICYDVGFNTVSNFNRQFKSVMNCTPTEFIRAHSN